MNPIEKPETSYHNPLLIALEYKEDLYSGKYRNQAALAKSLNVTRSRVDQYLRLLNLHEG